MHAEATLVTTADPTAPAVLAQECGLTIYTWPKSFCDPHIARIQRNAMRSWMHLTPRPAILVFGNEPGVAAFCGESGLRHVPDELAGIHGAVSIRELADKVEALSQTPFYCFVNADIILTNELIAGMNAVSGRFPSFLMGGSPWNLEVLTDLDFESGWDRELKQRALNEGEPRGYNCSDFFLYRRGYLRRAPPLLIGRNHVDNGLMWFTRKQGAALVDATTGALSVHQNHHYRHIGGEFVRPKGGEDALWNERCVGGKRHLFTWANATHHYTPSGIRPYLAGKLWKLGAFSWQAKLINRLVWVPLARITAPVRTLLGARNPRCLTPRRDQTAVGRQRDE